MKKILFTLTFFAYAGFAQVQTPLERETREDTTLQVPFDPLAAKLTTEAPTMNIQKGNWNVDGNLWLRSNSINSKKCCQTAYEVGLEGSRFVAERVAVGATFSIGRDESYGEEPWALVGPKVDYYFWQGERTAAYSSLEGAVGLTDATIRGRAAAEVGMKYFFTSAVAFGPYLEGKRTFRHGTNRDFNSLSFGANFGIYL